MTVETNLLPPRYRGPRRIAHGGMGEIYRATDDVLGRAVAIKLLSERYSADEAIVARFTREALAAARLSNQPNSVTIFDVGEWNERPFIVMEYLPGGSLADRLEREGAQPPERVMPWLEQAATALDAAHRNGIVHRDVKPANLLLDREGAVHVADFGIASAVGLDSLTSTGMILGTAGYLSPEQARGESTTPASDRYALGVTAFELLTGDRPFRSETSTAEAVAHAQAPIPSISSRRPDLPRELDPVFERALAKDPDARYPTCADFVADLGDAFDRGAQQTQVTALLPTQETDRRRRMWIPVLALAAAAAAGIATAALLDGGTKTVRETVIRTTALRETVRETVTQSTTVQQTVTAAAPPSSPDGHQLNDEGYRLLQQGDYEGALPLLQQAVEKLRGAGPGDPYEAYANFNLGVTLLQLGRCDEALIPLQVADRLEEAKEVEKAIKRAEKCLKKEGGEAG